MAGKRVLVVDDDVKTVELVKLYLNRDGYKVLTAYDGIEALRLARERHPDLIVLDLMLPGLDGLQVCRALRAESDVPIIMLTAMTTEQDRLTGLDLGADDYVTKPFSPKELAARVRAVLRRIPGERGPVEIKHGELTVNFLKREASLGGRPLNLTPTEFKLLGVLIKEPGRVFSRAELATHDASSSRCVPLLLFTLSGSGVLLLSPWFPIWRSHYGDHASGKRPAKIVRKSCLGIFDLIAFRPTQHLSG